MQRQRTTLKDIAEKAGVSVATVSYVLNGTGSVGESVQELVRMTAKDLGYRKNFVARATRTGQTHTIGLIVPDLLNPFFPALAQAFQSAARVRGYAVFLIDSEGSPLVEREGAEDLMRRGAEGIAWCSATEEDVFEDLRDDIAIVQIDSAVDGYDVVRSNFADGAKKLADYFVQNGHRRFGIIAGPRTKSMARIQRESFMCALPADARIMWEAENPYSSDLAAEAMQYLGTEEVTAIFCANDQIAISVIKALDRLGKRVPTDVSVGGFDDIPWAQFSLPGLTTVHQPICQLAEKAVSRLLERMEGKVTKTAIIELSASLVIRDTIREPVDAMTVRGRRG